MSEQNAPHTHVRQTAALPGDTYDGPVENELEERNGHTVVDPFAMIPGSDMTYGYAAHPMRDVHLDYFARLIPWMQQWNGKTYHRGNAELMAQRMFSLLGRTLEERHIRHAAGMTMDEVRTHIYNLVDSLPDLRSTELTPAMLWQHRTVLDELYPYLRSIRLQPRSAAKAFTWRGSVRKSWLWLIAGI